MTRNVALAVDLGASSGRIVSGTFDGRILELEELHRFENGPVAMAGQLIWDLPRLWHEVVGGLRAAASRHGKAITTVGQVFDVFTAAGLLKLDISILRASKRGESLGLNDDEIAFYDALAANDSAVQAMGDEKLKLIAAELDTQMKKA